MRTSRLLSVVVVCLSVHFSDVVAASVPMSLTSSPAPVEVVEYFWYGCPHCYHLEPGLRKLLRAHAGDVMFRRVPVDVSFLMRAHQRMFYALTQLGREQDLTPLVQRAIVVDHTLLLTESGQADFFRGHGIAEADYRRAYESAAVTTACADADRRARADNVAHVPMLVIAGRYVASPERAVLDARARGMPDPDEAGAIAETLKRATTSIANAEATQVR
jgi:thiol:disulfide interchange protein DsbA